MPWCSSPFRAQGVRPSKLLGRQKVRSACTPKIEQILQPECPVVGCNLPFPKCCHLQNFVTKDRFSLYLQHSMPMLVSAIGYHPRPRHAEQDEGENETENEGENESASEGHGQGHACTPSLFWGRKFTSASVRPVCPTAAHCKCTCRTLGEESTCVESTSDKSFPWAPQQIWGTKLEIFCRYKALGNWESVARNAVQWDALLRTFLHFCSMWTLLPQFSERRLQVVQSLVWRRKFNTGTRYVSAKNLWCIAVALHSPKFCHRQYICICASHVFVGLPILVRRPAVHASARFNQQLFERLAM